MREQTVVQHPVAGEVTLSPSLRARRVSINVRPSGEVRLVYPCRMPARRALAFLDEKSEWVLAARERMARKRAVLPPPLPPEAETSMTGAVLSIRTSTVCTALSAPGLNESYVTVSVAPKFSVIGCVYSNVTLER